jgi:hypothetical protein
MAGQPIYRLSEKKTFYIKLSRLSTVALKDPGKTKGRAGLISAFQDDGMCLALPDRVIFVSLLVDR